MKRGSEETPKLTADGPRSLSARTRGSVRVEGGVSQWISRHTVLAGLAAFVAAVAVVGMPIVLFWRQFGQSHLDPFSFGQLFLAVLLVPFGVVGYLVGLQELRRARDVPDLDLYWYSQTDGATKEATLRVISAGGRERIPKRLALINRGPVLCEWYMVEVEVPTELSIEADDRHTFGHSMGGSRGCWTTTHKPDGSMAYAFMSNGQLAAYPEYPLQLGDLTLDVYPHRECPPMCLVRYKITQDRGLSREGVLTVTVVPRDLEKH